MVLLVVAALFGFVIGWVAHRRRAKRLLPAATAWRVESKATPRWLKVGHGMGRYGEDIDRVDVNQSVQVKLTSGESCVLIATVKITDDDYEEQIRAAIVKAEERASTLNALLAP